jgi:hypothetical protein
MLMVLMGMQMVAMCHVRMVRGFFVVSVLMVFVRFTVMVGSCFVVMCRVVVVIVFTHMYLRQITGSLILSIN